MLRTLPTAARADGNGELPWLVEEPLQGVLVAFLSPPGAFLLVGILASLGFAYFARSPTRSRGLGVSGVLAGCAAVALALTGGSAVGWGILAWAFGYLLALVLLIGGLLFLGSTLDRWAQQPRKPAGSRGTTGRQTSRGQVRNGA